MLYEPYGTPVVNEDHVAATLSVTTRCHLPLNKALKPLQKWAVNNI